MNVLVCCSIYLSHLLVEFNASLVGRIVSQKALSSSVFHHSASTIIVGVVDDRLR